MTRKHNGILKVLNEERGINEKVRQLTWNLSRVILEEYDGSGTFSGSFTAFDNDTYALKITFVDYPKLSLAPKSGDEIYYGTSYPEDKIIIIKGYTIRGKILKDKLAEVLQHEIHHIFELVMSEKDGFFNNQADTRIYTIAADEARNKEIPDFRRHIGYAVYMWNNFESRAFENGTYAFIMSQDLAFPGDEISAAKKSAYYKRIMWIKKARTFLENNKEESGHITEDVYGKTYDWLYKTVTYAEKECTRQYCRAIAKAGEDYDWLKGGKKTITI